jgi:hypothetical protein
MITLSLCIDSSFLMVFSLLLYQLHITWPPLPFDPELGGPIHAQTDEETFTWDCLEPIAVLAFGGLGTERNNFSKL